MVIDCLGFFGLSEVKNGHFYWPYESINQILWLLFLLRVKFLMSWINFWWARSIAKQLETLLFNLRLKCKSKIRGFDCFFPLTCFISFKCSLNWVWFSPQRFEELRNQQNQILSLSGSVQVNQWKWMSLLFLWS